MSILSRVYLEHGKPVTVLVQWAGKGPRNVLVERGDGTKVIRPFRGLRKAQDSPVPGMTARRTER